MGKRGPPPGTPRVGGRQKGTPNKLTGDVKASIVAAFDEVGGKDFLVQLAKDDPKTFCSLVGKVVPLSVGGDPENPLNLHGKIELVVVHPKG